MDVQAAVALGLSRNAAASGRRTVRFRLLQRNADLHRAGSDHHGSVQAPQLVRLLSDGHHDPADLQSKKRKMTPRRDFNGKNDSDTSDDDAFSDRLRGTSAYITLLKQILAARSPWIRHLVRY